MAKFGDVNKNGEGVNKVSERDTSSDAGAAFRLTPKETISAAGGR
jgi:hypothetical protein